MAFDDLKRNGMMAHLLSSLEAGEDIGHYGRLVFAMVARHFVSDEELVQKLCEGAGVEEPEALALVEQVKGRDYSPPRREKVLQFQQQQAFPILPDAEDPDAGNVYKDLQFPDEVYAHIQEYREQKAQAHAGEGAAAH
ncbi:hypothetical protein FGE12_23800 [Aggregicoccus sp. 17bor-14]|uniref:hypothetical protein n=1 Tax=Myxococcaceae TaxID=31 RepID=UPI00129C3BA6|nr:MULTISPECIES: hypothetical protein [Myxococcaceae]MBF5045452.1 hypothetical protein [Simulacricoccus sp. 17bor-14]MRI91191.1 hypothetical protein [Aggregicoccus sp. 17bor-14]